MKKSEIEPFLGKFVNISFTYKHKYSKESKYINAYGYVIKVESGRIGFKDNDCYHYMIAMDKIYSITDEGKRRTARQWYKLREEELVKCLKKEKLSKETINKVLAVTKERHIPICTDRDISDLIDTLDLQAMLQSEEANG